MTGGFATRLGAMLTLVAVAGLTAGYALHQATHRPRAVSAAATVTATGFPAALRAAFPALAEGRTDQALTDDAENTCLDLAQGKTLGQALGNVSTRFARGAREPAAAEAAAILALAARHLCPGQAPPAT